MSKKQKIYLYAYLVFTVASLYLAYLLSYFNCGHYCNDDGSLNIVIFPVIIWYILTLVVFVVGAYEIPKNRFKNRLTRWSVTIAFWAVIIFSLTHIFK